MTGRPPRSRRRSRWPRARSTSPAERRSTRPPCPTPTSSCSARSTLEPEGDTCYPAFDRRSGPRWPRAARRLRPGPPCPQSADNVRRRLTPSGGARRLRPDLLSRAAAWPPGWASRWARRSRRPGIRGRCAPGDASAASGSTSCSDPGGGARGAGRRGRARPALRAAAHRPSSSGAPVWACRSCSCSTGHTCPSPPRTRSRWPASPCWRPWRRSPSCTASWTPTAAPRVGPGRSVWRTTCSRSPGPLPGSRRPRAWRYRSAPRGWPPVPTTTRVGCFWEGLVAAPLAAAALVVAVEVRSPQAHRCGRTRRPDPLRLGLPPGPGGDDPACLRLLQRRDRLSTARSAGSTASPRSDGRAAPGSTMLPRPAGSCRGWPPWAFLPGDRATGRAASSCPALAGPAADLHRSSSGLALPAG